MNPQLRWVRVGRPRQSWSARQRWYLSALRRSVSHWHLIELVPLSIVVVSLPKCPRQYLIHEIGHIRPLALVRRVHRGLVIGVLLSCICHVGVFTLHWVSGPCVPIIMSSCIASATPASSPSCAVVLLCGGSFLLGWWRYFKAPRRRPVGAPSSHSDVRVTLPWRVRLAVPSDGSSPPSLCAIPS